MHNLVALREHGPLDFRPTAAPVKDTEEQLCVNSSNTIICEHHHLPSKVRNWEAAKLSIAQQSVNRLRSTSRKNDNHIRRRRRRLPLRQSAFRIKLSFRQRVRTATTLTKLLRASLLRTAANTSPALAITHIPPASIASNDPRRLRRRKHRASPARRSQGPHIRILRLRPIPLQQPHVLNLPPLELPPLAVPPRPRDILLPEPVVGASHPRVPRHDAMLHIRSPGIV